MTNKLVILDRDGVINQDSADYVKSAAEWIPLPGSIDAIARLKHKGFTVAIATNQSGIGRGYYDETALAEMHAKLGDLLASQQAKIDTIAWCPHTPDDHCDCRKPKPGLLHQIEHTLNLPLQGAWVIGDSLRDLQAAVAVGAQPILVLTGNGEKTATHPELPSHTKVFTNLTSAVDFLLKNHG